MLAVSEHLDQFGDAAVAVVTFATTERLSAYATQLGVPFPLLSDPERRLYALVGAQRGSRLQIWSVGTLRMYAGLLLRGRRLRRPTEDVHQLGADLVVGRDGRVRYVALPLSPDARPPISELIAALD